MKTAKLNLIPGKLHLAVRFDGDGNLVVFDTETNRELAYQREVTCRQIWDGGEIEEELIDVTVRFMVWRDTNNNRGQDK